MNRKKPRAPWFRLWAADLFSSSDFLSLSGEARGVLYSCYLSSWLNDAELPGSAPDLAAAVSLPKESVARCLPALIQRGHLRRRGKSLVCPYIASERAFVARMYKTNLANANSPRAKKYHESRKTETTNLKNDKEKNTDRSPTGHRPVTHSESESEEDKERVVSESGAESVRRAPVPAAAGGVRNDFQKWTLRNDDELRKIFENDVKIQELVWRASDALNIDDWSERYFRLIDLASNFGAARFNGALAVIEDYKANLLDPKKKRKPLKNPFGLFTKCVANGLGRA